MEITYNQFFRNMTSLPSRGTKEFNDLIDWEIEKCIGGVTVDGVFFSGWLYWHLNHWYIRIDDIDKYGNDIRIIKLPDLRDNEWIRAEALERCRIEKKGYMEVGARQGGKDLLNSSKLYMQDSETTIGDCNIGDKIYGPDGNLTTIVGKYPQGKKPVYKLKLVDGREIFCGLEHNWYVYDRDKKVHIVKTTSELIENYKRYRKSWNSRKNPYEYKYSITNIDPVKYEERYQEIPAYLLGLWLGDGSSYYSKITTIDDEIVGYLSEYCENNNLSITKDGKLTYMITSGTKGGNQSDKRNKFHEFLKDKKLYKNKHIPNEYLRGSIEQRLELLKGLMDTDGSRNKDGRIEFCTSLEELANDFEFLCRSLGISVKRTKSKASYKNKNGEYVKCKDRYRFSLFTELEVFKLSRKKDKTFNKSKYADKCAIIDIQYVFDDETTCIRVDNNSHLFLTDGFTVTHNSELEASYLAYNAILFQNTQNVIVAGNDADLNLLKDKVDTGLKKLWEGISIPRLDKTWRGNSIRLGYKLPNGDDEVWSHIIIRNAADGKNTEAAAGTTAKSFIMDEVGKYPFASSYEAAEPAFRSRFGWRAVPILVGTGGSFEKGQDAERFFYHPAANNFLGFKDPISGKETCLFMSGLYRQDCKTETTLGKWLEETGKAKSTPELEKIPIRVANKELALKKINDEREEKRKDPNQSDYLKKIMYYPLTPEECFLTVSNNIFNIRSARAQQQRLYDNEIVGSNVFLFHDGEKISHEFTDKKPISIYPHDNVEDKDAPIQIWEMPIKDPPFGLYVAGVDPYRQAKSSYSDSLGAVYIFKRMHDIHSEKFQHSFVASYVARPDDKSKWDDQARLLIKYYNARTLCENDEMSFIEYMKAKGDARYLEKQPPWLKEIVPNTTVAREYGIHRSSERIREHLHGCLKTYLDEKLLIDKDETGSVIRELLGVYQVKDPLLLEEIIKFNDEDNFDRIIAAELALAMAAHLDPMLKITSTESDGRIKELFSGKKGGGLFGVGKSLFGSRKGINKLF